MKVPYAVRPGAGFLLLALVTLLALLFFAWGLSTPRLDRVWRLSLELRLGRKKPLSHGDFSSLQRSLCEHPELAEDFLEGRAMRLISAHRDGLVGGTYAYLVRRAGSPALGVEISVPESGKKREIALRARTAGEHADGRAAPGEPFTFTPPGQGKCATLIEIIKSKGLVLVGEAR